MRTRVVNKKSLKGAWPADAVFVGRPSVWGNPFVIGRDGTREQVVAKYREYVTKQPELMARLPELYGKTLICYCAPLLCHGSVLAELAELDHLKRNP